MSKSDLIRQYHIERLSVNNLPDLGKLHTAVYKKPPPLNYFSRKYDTAYTGIGYTGFIAYNGKLPISYYGVIPCFIKYDDKIILAAQSADTMTHPRYRNKGLFVELATLTYHLCGDTGIQLVFGFPNQNSLHGFINKLGWQLTETMDCFIIPTGTPQWKRLSRKVPFFKNLYNRHQKTLEKYLLLRQQGTINSVSADGYAGVYRDYDYLKYKARALHRLIKMGGSGVWMKINNELLIGDMDIIPANFDSVMAVLKTFAYKIGIKEMHFHACKDTTLHGLFARRFNSISSFPVIFKEIGTNIQLDRIKFTSADIDTF